jgi:hypothetical protein
MGWVFMTDARASWLKNGRPDPRQRIQRIVRRSNTVGFEDVDGAFSMMEPSLTGHAG